MILYLFFSGKVISLELNFKLPSSWCVNGIIYDTEECLGTQMTPVIGADLGISNSSG